MKKLLAMLLCLLMTTALAESPFDVAELRRTENMNIFMPYGSVDTVVRPLNQPYMGQATMPEDGGIIAYVDYITLVDADATLLRLVVSIEAYDPVSADQMRITVGKKTYTFEVDYEQSEYDGLYMEDYVVCLTDASLSLLKAIAQQKKDEPIMVEFLSLGDVVFAGVMIIPGQEAAVLYDRFIDLGGKKQELKRLDATWPCVVK